MSIFLGWVVDKVLAWRSLHVMPRYALVGLIFALALGLAYVDWMGHLAQQDLWQQAMIRDAVH